MSLIFSIRLPLIILQQTSREFEKPIKSVPPWLFTTGESKPIKIAPLYNLGSNLFLNFFKFLIFNNDEIFPIKFPLNAFFSSLVIKFAVPSAVLRATLPVKPSETITLLYHSLVHYLL